ncbi:SRPBCC family protein [Gordonia desulfuricans]|uniref:SRPBCC family protein n=1 Tax=Gordonia desulfuricans TaxID=89051 RepID=A0A7K3LU23_9ACTN|nr:MULTISPECIES: SRPBCC family protein [Gordonia]EMP13020.2 polyketide cyclase [Gordonia sp. NB41Y]NDK91785.1 SRPBCC family protein [Gordonia desulfuricans]WLP92620.1 SRPBCC family protein [Gordonia sp. NB41Y]
MRSRHVSQVIAVPVARVYDFAADPDNLPRWAAGLARSTVTRRGDLLVADSPMGEVTVRFVERNDFGILDHDVTLPNGVVVTNPIRVLAHPDGAEVVFTLRQLDMSDEQFEQDAAMVADDLARLRDLVEQPA